MDESNEYSGHDMKTKDNAGYSRCLLTTLR